MPWANMKIVGVWPLLRMLRCRAEECDEHHSTCHGHGPQGHWKFPIGTAALEIILLETSRVLLTCNSLGVWTSRFRHYDRMQGNATMGERPRFPQIRRNTKTSPFESGDLKPSRLLHVGGESVAL